MFAADMLALDALSDKVSIFESIVERLGAGD